MPSFQEAISPPRWSCSSPRSRRSSSSLMGIFGKSKEHRTSLLDAHDDAHEQELRDAARRGDLATLIDLVEQGVNIEAADPQVLRAASLPTTPSPASPLPSPQPSPARAPPVATWLPPISPPPHFAPRPAPYLTVCHCVHCSSAEWQNGPYGSSPRR